MTTTALKISTLIAGVVLVSGCGSGTSTGPSPVTAISSITPSSGTTLGGTKVTIAGSNFFAGSTVTIGGAAATDVSVVSATSITATTPPHAAGAADVVVTSTDGHRGSLPGGFTFTMSPPVIDSIVVQGSVGPREPPQFASFGETVAVTASVRAAETPLSQLTFQWSDDSGGAFTGTGARVSWTAPRTLTTPAPATVTLTLTVKDAVNTVTGTTRVRVHDSIREVNDLAVDFLIGFSQQQPAAYVVRNFTNSCPGTAEEQSDVQKNNDQNTITSYTIGTPSTTIVFIGASGCPFRGVFGDACAQVPVEWHATSKSTGIAGVAKGTDQVTAVLENDQWKLCASDFNSLPSSTFILPFSRR